MAVSLLPKQILWDAFCCLGLGMAVAALHDAFSLNFGRILPDLAAAVLAAVMIQGYASAGSISGIPRGYMIIAMLAGVAAYNWVAAPFTASLRRWIWWCITRPFLLALIPAAAICRMCGKSVGSKAHEAKKIIQKSRKNKLKKEGTMMYNSYM